MTAEGIIRQLQNLIEHGLKPTAIIKSWDGDSEQFQPVSGFVYDLDSVELQTDSDDEESISAVLEGRGGELEMMRKVIAWANNSLELDALRGMYQEQMRLKEGYKEFLRKAEARAAQLEAALREAIAELNHPPASVAKWEKLLAAPVAQESTE